MLKWLLITNDAALAAIAYEAGVERLFVDLEVLGKQERQGHLDTVISAHNVEDVSRIRHAVPEAELMVRLNPIHPNTQQEVDAVVRAGADLLMLPMFKRIEEIHELERIVAGRVGIVPLLETAESISFMEAIAKAPGVVEMYMGLNDLHLSLEQDFIFQPLADGLVDEFAEIASVAGKPFGFGGVARTGEGVVSGETILAEHCRLGSSRVILSRSFYRPEHARSDGRDAAEIFSDELAKLREAENRLLKRTAEQMAKDHRMFVQAVNKVVHAKQSQ